MVIFYVCSSDKHQILKKEKTVYKVRVDSKFTKHKPEPNGMTMKLSQITITLL